MSKRLSKQVLLRDEEEAPPEGCVPTIRFEDAVLIERVRGGDVDAFGVLVSKYQDKVYNTCWRMCGHLEDARDLTQEAFLRAYQSLASFHGRSGFYTWVFRIAMNLALSHRRKARLRRAHSLDQEGGVDPQAEPLRDRLTDEAAEPPAQRVMASEMRQQVEEALNTLEPDHRAVVVLRDIEGFDYAEIAGILEIAPGTVKSRLHRARATLRARLQPYVDDEHSRRGK
ncbi:MAG: sigma-70 family RNA polymerase sigma factor [Planctomycetota bacterium]